MLHMTHPVERGAVGYLHRPPYNGTPHIVIDAKQGAVTCTVTIAHKFAQYTFGALARSHRDAYDAILDTVVHATAEAVRAKYGDVFTGRNGTCGGANDFATEPRVVMNYSTGDWAEYYSWLDHATVGLRSYKCNSLPARLPGVPPQIYAAFVRARSQMTREAY